MEVVRCLQNLKMGFSRVIRSFLPLLFFFLIINCSSESEVLSIDVSEAKNLVDSGHAFLDVRTVEEYKKGHVAAEKIFNVPYWFFTPQGREKNPNFLQDVMSVCKKTDNLVVSCKSGVRSLYAATDLLVAGFKNARNMEGGYEAWVDNKFPVRLEEHHLNNEL